MIVDIGAHIGLSCIYFTERYPDAKIYSYEPHSDNFKLLEQNITQNNLDIDIFNMGVSNKQSEQHLYELSHKGTAVHTTVPDNRQAAKTHLIECTTIEHIVNDNNIPRIDILKLDCEGAEYAILDQPAYVLDKIDTIVMEYHDINSDDNFDNLTAHLTRNGFTLQFNNTLNTSPKTGMAMFYKDKL